MESSVAANDDKSRVWNQSLVHPGPFHRGAILVRSAVITSVGEAIRCNTPSFARSKFASAFRSPSVPSGSAGLEEHVPVFNHLLRGMRTQPVQLGNRRWVSDGERRRGTTDDDGANGYTSDSRPRTASPLRRPSWPQSCARDIRPRLCPSPAPRRSPTSPTNS